MPCFKETRQTFFSFFKMLDFFSMKPSDRITFRKKQTYSTIIGQFSSWILIGIYIATFMNFGSDMIYHQNPQSILSQIVTPDPEILNLDEIGFFMAFGLQDLRNDSAQYIDESVYTVELIERTKENGNFTLQTIPTGPCNLDSVPDRDDLKSYYARNSITSLYCIQNDSEVPPELKSTWDGPIYKNLLINIYPCENSSQNGNFCKPPDVLAAYLNNANFAIFFTTDAVDSNNFEKPITSYGYEIFTPISFSTLTYIEMLFGHYNFITDVGFLFQDLEQFNSASYISDRQVLSFSSDLVVQIDMKLDKIKTIYNRKYDKLQNVLAEIGGIIKALMIFSNMLILPFVRLKFRLNLANTIFTFKTDKATKGFIKKLKKNKITSSENDNNNIMKEKLKEKPLELSLEKKKKRDGYQKSETTKVQISYFRYFLNCVNNSTSRAAKKLLNQGLAQIDEVLDISYIMKKIVEIDLLKILLLTEEQNNLFNCIPKPELVLGDENKKEDLTKSLHMKFSCNLLKKTTCKSKIIQDSMQYLMNKNLKTPVDRKLIDMMNSSFIKKRKAGQLENIHQKIDVFKVGDPRDRKSVV